MQRSTRRFQGSGETCSTWSFGKDGNSYRPLYWRKLDQCTATRKPVASIWAKIRTIVRRPQVIQTMIWCRFEVCRTRTILLYSWNRRRTTDATFMPRIHDASKWKGGLVWDDGFARIRESAQSWTWKFAVMKIDTVLKLLSSLCFKTEPLLGLESWTVLIHTWQNRCWPRKKRTQLRRNPLPKQDQDRSPQKRWHSFIFLFLKGNGSTLKHNDHTITSDMKCPKPSPDGSRHDQSVPRGSDGAIHYCDIIEKWRIKKFDGASQWLLENWLSTLAEGGGAKKRFQCCVNPNSSNQFLYLRAIQGHSGDKCCWSYVARQMYCYRKDLPSTSTTSGTRMNWILSQEMN